ncbi:MAG TPA: hypothetical protein PKW15_00065 [Alphaproteobacteria bacterium]|nr:hypothetical protein [Rhodospirillaceae bacterium]HRJ11618.1 hypothetical protein [Alphaproteobacteria bacterium]
MKRLILCCAIWLCLPQAAHAISCNQTTPPKITLERSETPIQYDFAQNRTSLNQIGAEILAASPGGATSSHVGGLTNGTISSNMSTQLQTLTSPDGSACIWISEVIIRLQYQPIVYVSREFAPGSCYHAAVLEHEHKHVSVDRALITMFAPELQNAIQNVAATKGRAGPISKVQLESTSRTIQKAIEDELNRMMDNLSTVRSARQAQIDTPQEYMRVQRLCVNWP